jgi:hypothetical protein
VFCSFSVCATCFHSLRPYSWQCACMNDKEYVAVYLPVPRIEPWIDEPLAYSQYQRSYTGCLAINILFVCAVYYPCWRCKMAHYIQGFELIFIPTLLLMSESYISFTTVNAIYCHRNTCSKTLCKPCTPTVRRSSTKWSEVKWSEETHLCIT